MTESTARLLDEMVRHTRGMLASVEKWIARERPALPIQAGTDQTDSRNPLPSRSN